MLFSGFMYGLSMYAIYGYYKLSKQIFNSYQEHRQYNDHIFKKNIPLENKYFSLKDLKQIFNTLAPNDKIIKSYYMIPKYINFVYNGKSNYGYSNNIIDIGDFNKAYVDLIELINLNNISDECHVVLSDEQFEVINKLITSEDPKFGWYQLAR